MKASLPAKAPDAYGRKSETAECKGEQRCYRRDITCFGKRTSVVGNPRCLRSSRDIGSLGVARSLRHFRLTGVDRLVRIVRTLGNSLVVEDHGVARSSITITVIRHFA